MAELEQENVFITNLAGVEDLLLGLDIEQQVRDGEIKATTAINAHNIPYKKIVKGVVTITTIGDVLDDLLKAGGTV